MSILEGGGETPPPPPAPCATQEILYAVHNRVYTKTENKGKGKYLYITQ